MDRQKDSSHYNKKNIPYEFRLLYRSSRDGVDAKSFHRNCENKGATIFVAKIRGSTQLIGGLIGMEMVGKVLQIVLYLTLQMEKMFPLQNWVTSIMVIVVFYAVMQCWHLAVWPGLAVARLANLDGQNGQ